MKVYTIITICIVKLLPRTKKGINQSEGQGRCNSKGYNSHEAWVFFYPGYAFNQIIFGAFSDPFLCKPLKIEQVLYKKFYLEKSNLTI